MPHSQRSTDAPIILHCLNRDYTDLDSQWLHPATPSISFSLCTPALLSKFAIDEFIFAIDTAFALSLVEIRVKIYNKVPAVLK
jgi:hypothetical protein